MTVNEIRRAELLLNRDVRNRELELEADRVALERERAAETYRHNLRTEAVADGNLLVSQAAQKEQERSNKVRELETERSNRAREEENYRAAVAAMEEQIRSNLARENETERHNRITEEQGYVTTASNLLSRLGLSGLAIGGAGAAGKAAASGGLLSSSGVAFPAIAAIAQLLHLNSDPSFDFDAAAKRLVPGWDALLGGREESTNSYTGDYTDYGEPIGPTLIPEGEIAPDYYWR